MKDFIDVNRIRVFFVSYDQKTLEALDKSLMLAGKVTMREGIHISAGSGIDAQATGIDLDKETVPQVISTIPGKYTYSLYGQENGVDVCFPIPLNLAESIFQMNPPDKQDIPFKSIVYYTEKADFLSKAIKIEQLARAKHYYYGVHTRFNSFTLMKLTGKYSKRKLIPEDLDEGDKMILDLLKKDLIVFIVRRKEDFYFRIKVNPDLKAFCKMKSIIDRVRQKS